MIRFILKTIEERPTFRTVDVKNNDFAPLNDVLIGAKYEIIGTEHFMEFDEVIVGNMRITSKGISFAGDSEPKFPEKYTPVIARDNNNSNWYAAVFMETHTDSFETGYENFRMIAPLKGNEHVMGYPMTPFFYWIAENGKTKLIKS